MGFLSEVKRGARAVAKEAETRTQLAMKHAEAANLRSAAEEAVAEAGREMLTQWETAGKPPSLPLPERAKALFEEVRRLEDERSRLHAEMDRLRAASVFAKDARGNGEPGKSAADAAAASPVADAAPSAGTGEGGSAGAPRP